MEDYKEEIRKLLQKFYYNSGQENNKILRSTAQILDEVRGVIPNQPITQHDIFELMKDMYFEQEQEIIYEQVCTFEGNKEEGLKPEYEQREVSRMLLWKMFQK